MINNIFLNLRKTVWMMAAVTTVTAVSLSIGCGQAGNQDDLSPNDAISLPSYDNTDDLELPNAKPLTSEEFIAGPLYSGYLYVAPPDGENYVSPSIKEQILAQGLSFEPLIRNEISARYKRTLFRLRSQVGKDLPDATRWIKVNVQGKEAVELYQNLKAKGYKVVPAPIKHPTGITSVPDLIPYQGYLTEFNATALWNAGADGSNVIVYDDESNQGINEEHLDLPNVGYETVIGDPCTDPSYCSKVMAHGTAVIGIIASKDNDAGTKGFAPSVTVGNGFGSNEFLYELMQPENPYRKIILKPGDIFLSEFSTAGAKTGSAYGTGYTPWHNYGSLPSEVIPPAFEAIQTAVAYGITVIMPSGNGSVNLDDSSYYFTDQINLSENDSGSIIVGASQKGLNNRVKAPFSSCGSPVDLHAWGYSVVTTAYPTTNYEWLDYPWLPSLDDSDPSTAYTNDFGGTSAAGAMIAGAAALVQSYAKQQLGSEYRYLRPWKLKEILIASGQAQQVGGYQTGKACPVSAWGVNLTASACSSNELCIGVNPSKGVSCQADSDCMIAGGYETINPDCVNGKCGSSFCASYCGSGWSCPTGWSPLMVTDSAGTTACVCYPPLKSVQDEACNIGVQPKLDVAKQKLDSFVANMRLKYPKLVSGQKMTLTEINGLMNDGVGLICGEADPITHEIDEGDNICPPMDDDILFPQGSGISKKLDFDGDGRADLVSWSNGEWKLDLSSSGSSTDGFGAWDLTIRYPALSGKWVWPYVADMDSDGRADFVVYEKDTGKWYIKFTRFALLAGGSWTGWDRIVSTGVGAACKDEMKMDYRQSKYGRPIIFDDDTNGWMDLTIVCSDGIWRVDYGGPNASDYGSVDYSETFLSADRLSKAPGWAYIPFYYGNSSGSPMVAYRIPEGFGTDSGTIVGGSYGLGAPESTWKTIYMPKIRGDKAILLNGIFLRDSHTLYEYVSYINNGYWPVYTYKFESLYELPPSIGFGDDSCAPIGADFDGDGYDDRAVFCPSGWKIAYSGNNFSSTTTGGFREIPLGFDYRKFVLPGMPYFGGIGYDTALAIIDLYVDDYPNDPPPIPIDMARFVFGE